MHPSATAEEVFRIGICFENTARLLFESVAPIEPAHAPVVLAPETEIGAAPPWVVPFVVNLSFGVELYLKAIIWHETNTPQSGHRLEELFHKLQPTTQSRIEQNYNALIASPKSSIEIELGAVDFHTVLRTCSNAFPEWRYSYERNMTCGVVLIQPIARAVREAIIELVSPWECHVGILSTPPA